MKIAIPVDHDSLHGHFGGCRAFAIVDVDPVARAVLGRHDVPAPEHRPGFFPVWLRDQGVRVVIAGGIGRRALGLFAEHGISVHAGAPGTPVGQLVDAFLAGALDAPPAACTHEEGHEGHTHHHHH